MVASTSVSQAYARGNASLRCRCAVGSHERCRAALTADNRYKAAVRADRERIPRKLSPRSGQPTLGSSSVPRAVVGEVPGSNPLALRPLHAEVFLEPFIEVQH